ncbi:hypothetical protein [Lacrimispora sp.]|uniref:hypothetical protein n=1 Tax=Lacrimispora sp. TaxID=2719234 RepID=UPI003460CBE1
MPVPVMTIISRSDGEMGNHFPELMIVPHEAESYSWVLRMGAEIYHYLRLTDRFPICGIFNGSWKEDSEGQCQMMKMLKDRFLMAFNANGAVIGLEEAGPVSNALNMVEEAIKAGCKVIISGDRGETEEDFLADMAVAVGADYVKFGAPCRGEWTAKYNEMLRIEEFYNVGRGKIGKEQF